MRKSDFRNPLLQSGALLFILLVFFSFVATSGADSFGSGLLAIISGIFHSALFVIGLILSILISIILLIALFLAATALYSLNKAQDLWMQLQSTLLHIFTTVNDFIIRKQTGSLETFRSQTAQLHTLERELAVLRKENNRLQRLIDSQEKRSQELHRNDTTQYQDDQAVPGKTTKDTPSC